MPTFASAQARTHIDQLMQPALIRVIDNLRKQLDDSDWQGQYEEELLWPEGTTDAQKEEYAQLQKVLHGVPPEEHDRVAAQMSALPQPSPLYRLCLTKPGMDNAQAVDVWDLCYRVCATESSYDAESGLEPDLSLIDEEAADIDWRRLDDKAKALIAQAFDNLSAE